MWLSLINLCAVTHRTWQESGLSSLHRWYSRKVVYLHSTDGTARLCNPAPCFFLPEDFGSCPLSVTGHSSYCGKICFLSVLSVVDPEGPGTPLATVSIRKRWSKWVVREYSQVLAQNSEEGQSWSHTSVLCRCLSLSTSKTRCFLPAGRHCSLLSRILPVATQPCDSHWICAKSVFENARCQKRKSRGRPHDRNRPVETETKRAFLLHQTLCQRSKHTGGREEKMWPEHHVLYPPSIEISASP